MGIRSTKPIQSFYDDFFRTGTDAVSPASAGLENPEYYFASDGEVADLVGYNDNEQVTILHIPKGLTGSTGGYGTGGAGGAGGGQDQPILYRQFTIGQLRALVGDSLTYDDDFGGTSLTFTPSTGGGQTGAGTASGLPQSSLDLLNAAFYGVSFSNGSGGDGGSDGGSHAKAGHGGGGGGGGVVFTATEAIASVPPAIIATDGNAGSGSVSGQPGGSGGKGGVGYGAGGGGGGGGGNFNGGQPGGLGGEGANGIIFIQIGRGS